MTRKTNDPNNPPKQGDGSVMGQGRGDADGRATHSSIFSLNSSPAFDVWLDDQTKRLTQATMSPPQPSLIELIQNWPPKDHK